MADLTAHYTAMLLSTDAARRQLAQEQLRRLAGTAHAEGDPDHVGTPDDRLLSAIAALTGPLTARSNGSHVGTCPWHDSRSGTCLVAWPDSGRWWCSSCKQGGDLAHWVALTEGVAYHEARTSLGLPPAKHNASRKRRRRLPGRTLPADWRPSGVSIASRGLGRRP